jgi:hypothetical protein
MVKLSRLGEFADVFAMTEFDFRIDSSRIAHQGLEPDSDRMRAACNVYVSPFHHPITCRSLASLWQEIEPTTH